jgi:hypothetical protein
VGEKIYPIHNTDRTAHRSPEAKIIWRDQREREEERDLGLYLCLCKSRIIVIDAYQFELCFIANYLMGVQQQSEKDNDCVCSKSLSLCFCVLICLSTSVKHNCKEMRRIGREIHGYEKKEKAKITHIHNTNNKTHTNTHCDKGISRKKKTEKVRQRGKERESLIVTLA